MSPRRTRAAPGDADLRQHLIDTAAALLAQRPVMAVTTRDIARAAGVSDGVLYNYFDDKSALLVAALVRRFESVVTDAGHDLPTAGTGTVPDNLRASARALYDLSRASFPMLAGLVNEPDLLRRVMGEIHRPDQGIAPFLDHIGGYLAAEQQLGRIGDMDIRATMLLLTGAVAVLLMSEHIRALTAQPPDVPAADQHQLDAIIAVLMRCLAP